MEVYRATIEMESLTRILRAAVDQRAQLSAERGVRALQRDCSVRRQPAQFDNMRPCADVAGVEGCLVPALAFFCSTEPVVWAIWRRKATQRRFCLLKREPGSLFQPADCGVIQIDQSSGPFRAGSIWVWRLISTSLKMPPP
jgi:hypothetical protein